MQPIYLSRNGRTQSMAAWCRELGLSRQAISHRFKAGWTIHEALESDPVKLAEIRHRKAIATARRAEETRRANGTHRNGSTGTVNGDCLSLWEQDIEATPQPEGRTLPGMAGSMERIEELHRRAQNREELFSPADAPDLPYLMFLEAFAE